MAFTAFCFLILLRPLISSLTFAPVAAAHTIALLAVTLLAFLRTRSAQKPCLRLPGILVLASGTLTVFRAQLNQEISLSAVTMCCGILGFWYTCSLDDRRRKELFSCLLAALALIVILALYQFFFGFRHVLDYLSGYSVSPYVLEQLSSRRVFIPFITPNALAGYLCLLIPLCLPEKNKAAALDWKTWLGAAALLALLMTQSIGAITSLMAAAWISYWAAGKSLRKPALLACVTVTALLAVIVIRHVFSSSSHLPMFSLKARLGYWAQTLTTIAQAPLLGTASGSTVLPSSMFSHNSYLQLWAEQGIIGLGAFVFFVVELYRKALHRRGVSWQALTAVTAFLLHNLLDFTFYLPEVSLTWWIIAGLAAEACFQTPGCCASGPGACSADHRRSVPG